MLLLQRTPGMRPSSRDSEQIGSPKLSSTSLVVAAVISLALMTKLFGLIVPGASIPGHFWVACAIRRNGD